MIVFSTGEVEAVLVTVVLTNDGVSVELVQSCAAVTPSQVVSASSAIIVAVSTDEMGVSVVVYNDEVGVR